jgi:opacity protein-like surface antigen
MQIDARAKHSSNVGSAGGNSKANMAIDNLPGSPYPNLQVRKLKRLTILSLMNSTTKRVSRIALALVLTLGFAFTGLSQDKRFYGRIDMGGTIPSDMSLNSFFGPVASGSTVTLDPGFRVGMAGGYQVTDWFSGEIELAGMYNSIKSMTGATVLDDATFSNVPLLFNIKLQLPNRTRFVPYIGAGAGVSFSILDASYIQINGPTGITGFSGTASTAVFAWQAIGGVRFDLNDQMGLCVEYRFFWADNPSWEYDYYSGYYPPPGNSISFGHSQSQVISLAFEFRF